MRASVSPAKDHLIMARIIAAAGPHRRPWERLRGVLWPEASEADHAEDIAKIINNPNRYAAFLARQPAGDFVAFAEAAIRNDYVNGCDFSPVAFLEGIFVEPTYRRAGIARALCAAVETWASAQGCSEFASDAEIGNVTSHRMHAALGFTETERVVFFRKLLPQ
jgi:aminoglycoside 6'-N-acetyltransferase I